MFKWLKDRWNYLMGKSWEKQPPPVIEKDLFYYTNVPATVEIYDRDLADKENAVEYAEEANPAGWHDEGLESLFGEKKPKKKSKKKKSKKGKKK